MHVPDGFIGLGTSLGAGVAAGSVLSVAAKKAEAYLDDRRVPLAGLVAAFVFALQMLNFPVAAGTSGHLLGGVLAAILVGPWTGALAVSVVVGVQALFADGGLSALGVNVVNIALVPALGGYALFALIRRFLPKSGSPLILAAGVAAGLSVVLSAGAFVIEYWIGGTSDIPISTLASAMLGVHTLIGIGEGVITAMTLGAVLSVRPDLVSAASDLTPGDRVVVEGRAS